VGFSTTYLRLFSIPSFHLLPLAHRKVHCNGSSFSPQHVLPGRSDGSRHRRNAGHWPGRDSGSGRSRCRHHSYSGADSSLIPQSFLTQIPLTSPKRDLSNLETKKAVEALGRKATIYTADVSSPASVASIVPAVLKDGNTIQILINCAGINRRHLSHQFPDNDWNEVRVWFFTADRTRWIN
jgi:hypothetical protein